MLNKNYQNILLSHLFVYQKDFKRGKNFDLSENEKSLIRNDWDLENDIYYNKNLNDTYGFMLEVNNNEK